MGNQLKRGAKLNEMHVKLWLTLNHLAMKSPNSRGNGLTRQEIRENRAIGIGALMHYCEQGSSNSSRLRVIANFRATLCKWQANL